MKLALNNLLSLLVLACFVVGQPKIAIAQGGDYKSRIQSLQSSITSRLSDPKNGLYLESDSSKNENPHSWLWPLCAYIQAANEMEVLEPGKSYMEPIVKAIDQYYSDKTPVPAYQDYVTQERINNRYYDDNEWVAIAYLDAYNRTHKDKYLQVSKMIYRFIQSGTDTVSGGGVYWKEGDKSSKNTCSNGPAILVALQLYLINKNQEEINNALAIYRWTNRYLQAPGGIYYDNLRVPSLKISKPFYTYNTGTMLQSNVLLYRITKDKKYLREAQRIAQAGKDHFFKNERLPSKNYWFNAVMLRGYVELYKIDKNKAWLDFFKKDADGIWKDERNSENMVGPERTKTLIDQAAMIEIYARLTEAKANR